MAGRWPGPPEPARGTGQGTRTVPPLQPSKRPGAKARSGSPRSFPEKLARSPGPTASSRDGTAGRHGGPRVPSEGLQAQLPFRSEIPRGHPDEAPLPGTRPLLSAGAAGQCVPAAARPPRRPPLTPVKHEDREQVMQPLGRPGADVVLGVQAEDAQRAHEGPDDGELLHVLPEEDTSPPRRPRGCLSPAGPPAPPPPPTVCPWGAPASPAPHEEHPSSRPPGGRAGQPPRHAGRGPGGQGGP